MSKRKSIFVLSAVGLVAYAGFLLATLPAAFIWQYLPTGNKVSLQGLSGTLWSGQARQVTINNGPNRIQLPVVNWNWQPSALLSGHLAANIQLGNISSVIEGRGHVAYGLDGIRLNDVQVDTSAGWISQFMEKKIPGELSGNISLTADNLQIQNGRCLDLSGSLELTDSMISGPMGSIDLGESDASIKCKGNKLLISLNQSSPDFQTTADISLSKAGQYSLTGHLSKGNDIDSKLEQGLMLLGSPDAEGRYPIDFQGRI